MKIYDCFTFYNEYDILEIRLQTYYDYVDYFVISECNKIHTGGDKPYNYLEHSQRFSKYADKIIYIKADANQKVEDVKRTAKNKVIENWGIENFQRNALINGLSNCSPEDIIIVSDLDEFVPIELLKELKSGTSKKSLFKVHRPRGKKNLLRFIFNPKLSLQKRKVWPTLKYKPLVVTQRMYYYFMNTIMNDIWRGSVICLYKNLTTPQQLRNIRNETYTITEGKDGLAGWHFSYLGGREKIKEKLRSIVDGHNAFKYENLDQHIDDCLQNQKDLFGRGFVFTIQNDNEIMFPNITELKTNYPLFFYTITK